MNQTYREESVPVVRIGIIVGVVLFAILAMVGITKSFVNVNAGEIVVVQHPVSGEYEVYTTPGMHGQYWGTTTTYHKSFQYWFDGNEKENHSAVIPTKFYDGGHAGIPGSARIDLPLDKQSMIAIHTKFGSQEAIEHQLIGQTLIKAVSMSGPLMSSKESYAEKKNNLVYYIEDQAASGIYRTTQKDVKVVDALTNQEKVTTAVEILLDSAGLPQRQEKSLLKSLNIQLTNLSLGDFQYDDVVKKQIATQQNATMSVQTAIANAKRAEQDAITVEQQGKADAAKAKWEQEVIKAKVITEAQQELEKARLNAQTEAQNKLAMQLKGEGEAAYKRAVTQANNNLELRLNAAIEINKAYASAMASSNWVPTYVGGSGAGGAMNGGGALDLIHLMTANAAREAGLTVPNPAFTGSGKKE